jgi:phospholipase D1/2
MTGADSFERYFLNPVDSDEFYFLTPRRLACKVEPLVDRTHAFQAMEQAIVQAKQTVHLAGWVFFPETPLLNEDVRRTTGGRNWLDLIRYILTQDALVKVRIIITDFDPFFETGNHRLCWSSLSSLMKLRSRLPSDRQSNLEFISSLHEYFVTPSLITLGFLSVKDEINAVITQYNGMQFSKAIKLFRRTPGHWGSIIVNTTKKKFKLSSSPETRAFVASHHQKFCIVDGLIAFCGGMDITPLAHDTRNHKRRRHPFKRGEFDLSWHDIHSRVEGLVVNDIERNFRERWNQEIFVFLNRLTAFAAATPDGGVLPIPSLSPIPDLGDRATKRPGSSVVQALRTVSINKSGQFLPDLKRQDILDTYSAAIGSAKHFIYMENQYFRAPEITDLIIARHKEVPRLQFILVIPIAPEELTDPKSADTKVLHPIAVQIEQIERLKTSLGKNFGVFSLVLRTRSTKKAFTDAFGSPQLYVHSKICIIDDEYATIGSANINGRSFRMDSELNISWFHNTEVRKFRLVLWQHLLGNHAKDLLSWNVTTFAARWQAAAALNAKQPAETRGGFVIPHDNELLKDVAKKNPIIPECIY